jgi:hypothetical protein
VRVVRHSPQKCTLAAQHHKSLTRERLLHNVKVCARCVYLSRTPRHAPSPAPRWRPVGGRRGAAARRPDSESGWISIEEPARCTRVPPRKSGAVQLSCSVDAIVVCHVSEIRSQVKSTGGRADVSGGEPNPACIHEYTVFSRVFSHGSNTRIIRVNTYSEYVFST